MEKIKRLKETAEIEFVEKKSVFIAIAKRVNSEEEAEKRNMPMPPIMFMLTS